ncbi:MAG: hypothetical protein HZA93_04750 [Verrucomicrobia bacterium]|nr:hypothetical protein [Verrucomicrobiota bacterium]
MKPWARPSAATAALGALAFAAYANSFGALLLLDNAAIIGADVRLRATDWSDFVQIFTEGYWWPQFLTNLYRPLTTFSYWCNYTLLGHGDTPAGYHLVNLLLHLVNVLLLRRLASRIGAADGVAWLAAAIFAVHPLGVEVVTNIVGRADLLATLGVLGGSLAWLRADDEAGGHRSWRWRAAAGAIALAAVFAKENGIMVVAALALLEIHRSGWRSGIRTSATTVLPWMAPALIAIAVVRFVMQRHVADLPPAFVNNPIAYLGYWPGLMTAGNVAVRLLALVVWPAGLSCDYSYPQIPLFGESADGTWQGWGALLVLGLVAWTAGQIRRTRPLVAAGLVWAAVMYLPTSNFLVRIGSIMAERFMYLPLAGLALALAAALHGWGRPLNRRVTVALAAVILAAFTARTLVRNADWCDEVRFWRSAVAAAPRSFNVHKGLASALCADGRSEAGLDAAIAIVERALPLLEEPPLPLERRDNSLWGDLGQYYRSKGEFVLARGPRDEAVAWFEKSLVFLDRAHAVDRWVNAESRRRQLARGKSDGEVRENGFIPVHTQRAATLIRLGRLAEALETIRTLQRFAPLCADGFLLLAQIDRLNGDWEIAAVRYVEVLILDNKNEMAWRGFKEVYERLGIAPLPVQAVDGRRAFVDSSPRLRVQINTAMRDIVALLRGAKLHDEADDWIRRGMRYYGCPPEIFDEAGRGR